MMLSGSSWGEFGKAGQAFCSDQKLLPRQRRGEAPISFPLSDAAEKVSSHFDSSTSSNGAGF